MLPYTDPVHNHLLSYGGCVRAPAGFPQFFFARFHFRPPMYRGYIVYPQYMGGLRWKPPKKWKLCFWKSSASFNLFPPHFNTQLSQLDLVLFILVICHCEKCQRYDHDQPNCLQVPEVMSEVVDQLEEVVFSFLSLLFVLILFHLCFILTCTTQHCF